MAGVIVTAEWLSNEIKSDDFNTKYVILDATWDLPMSNRNFLQEYEACRIPGARFFSLGDCKNKDIPLPSTMPTPEYFESHVTALGISNQHRVILYDNNEKFGLFSAPRAWWLFNLFGHKNVSILDGGLPRWKKLGLPTETGSKDAVQPSSPPFKADFQSHLVKDLEFMKANLNQENPVQVLDARPNGRFRGIAPEPNPKIPSGHIPKSKNLQFFDCFDRVNNVMLPKEKLEEYIKSAGVDLEKEIVTTCGSGIAASSLAFGICVATGKQVPIFDGSWTEWQLNTPNEMQIREEKQD